MRNLIVHRYWKVDPDEVWAVVAHDLQPLRSAILALLADLANDG